MEITVLSALLISAAIYLWIGFRLGKQTRDIGDLFPVRFGKNARVSTVSEFSTSTVATTVSLATIILAYFELAGQFGLFLLWTSVTTAIGMFLVSASADRIWTKLLAYNHRPTMHEFLGTEFHSRTVAWVASVCTSIGFLLIFATELIVGSSFLAKFIPEIPEWITVVFLSGVGFIYTLFGGFRAVIKTDQIQMKFIWALILLLGGYYIAEIFQSGGWIVNLSKVPSSIIDFSDRDGLFIFLIGVTIMNIPTHLSNMSVWQRISGAQRPETVTQGLRKSIVSIFFSWSFLALLACFAYMFVTPTESQNLLSDLLITVGGSAYGKAVLFVVVVGLYGAMLSTASTNLIVVTHTVSEDIIAKFKPASLDERIQSKREFFISRIILVVSALTAVFIVAALKLSGFSIADLVFAIYGGALALFPPILFALFRSREDLRSLSKFATASVIFGFISGWEVAIAGKFLDHGSMIFLAPTVSIGLSFAVLLTGLMLRSVKNKSR